MVIMTSPWKHPKSGIYYLRKAIPEKLRANFSGKREIKLSLQTKDPKAVKRVFTSELERVERLISMAEEGNVTFSPKQSKALAGMWLKSQLQADDEIRAAQGRPDDEADALKRNQVPYETELDHIVDTVKVSEKERWVLSDIKDFLQGRGWVLPLKTSDGYGYLLDHFLEAKHRLYRVLSERAKGQWKTVDVDSIYPEFNPRAQLKKASAASKSRPKVLSGHSLLDLLEKYHSEKYVTRKTADDYAVSIGEFYKLVGVVPAEEVTTEQVRRFRDSLVAPGRDLASATITRKIGAVKAVLSYAMDTGIINSNPAFGIKVRKNDEGIASKIPYSESDLKKIFSSPVFTKADRPRAGAGEAAFWFPYISLYSGARLEEIGQLKTDDIQCVDGVHFFEITTEFDEDDEQRNLKTNAGRRIAPVHPRLVELGFLDYSSGGGRIVYFLIYI